MSRRRRKLVECFYCEKLFRRSDITRDHVIPQAKGGPDKDNLVDACEPCNIDKADRLPTPAEVQKFKRLNGGVHPAGQLGIDLMKKPLETAPKILIDSGTRRRINWENQVNARFQSIVMVAHSELEELRDEIDFLSMLKVDKILNRPLTYPGKVIPSGWLAAP